MSLRFGTDGVRGRVPEELNTHLAFALGRAVASVVGQDISAVIGGDTRASTSELAQAFGHGFAELGGSAIDLGVIPTPGVAFIARERSVLGVVISASHNPWRDNGIKIFAPGGSKLSDQQQADVERELAALLGTVNLGPDLPALAQDPTMGTSYIEHLQRIASECRPRDLVLDCANGASSGIANEVFASVASHLRVMHAEPDGTNINADCGSTHPQSLVEAVNRRAEHSGQSTIGFAFDGDADRVLAVDEFGQLVDGDGLIALLAVARHRRNSLPNHSVALTVMSNLGVRRFLEAEGIAVVETAVGDRSVTAAMEQHGIVVGGEQSGHVVLAEYAMTGDGMQTALATLGALDALGTSLHAFNSEIVRFPQLLQNVPLPFQGALESSGAFWEAVDNASESLGEDGRVLVRASGTEPLMRIMVEAVEESLAMMHVDTLNQAALTALAALPPPSL